MAVQQASEDAAGVRSTSRSSSGLPFLATKLALNNWVRLSGLVAWDVAAAYEAAGLSEPEFVAQTAGAAD